MNLLVKDVMNQTVIACVPDTRVEDLVRTLAEHEISGLPVIDVERKVVGIISESDLLFADEMEPPKMKTALFGLYVESERVMNHMARIRGVLAHDIMHKHVITCHPQTPLREVAQTLHDHKIKRLPVVDDSGELVGIVSRGDIIRALAEHMPSSH
ncbi:MAG: CBS domain-containing protein [Armatimonadota bacterium]